MDMEQLTRSTMNNLMCRIVVKSIASAIVQL